MAVVRLSYSPAEPAATVTEARLYTHPSRSGDPVVSGTPLLQAEVWTYSPDVADGLYFTAFDVTDSTGSFTDRKGVLQVLDGDIEDVPVWTPLVAQVERQIPTRGPFDEFSRPTAQQITDLALSLARGLQLDIGSRPVTPTQVQVARSYVEHATAARVEWNWYPEQQDVDGAGKQHDVWAAAELARLRVSLGLPASSAGVLAGDGPAQAAPLGAFPPPLPELLDTADLYGRRTREYGYSW